MPSQSGKQMILINNFAYQCNKRLKDKELWKCQESKKVNVNDKTKLQHCMAGCHITLDMKLISYEYINYLNTLASESKDI